MSHLISDVLTTDYVRVTTDQVTLTTGKRHNVDQWLSCIDHLKKMSKICFVVLWLKLSIVFIFICLHSLHQNGQKKKIFKK